MPSRIELKEKKTSAEPGLKSLPELYDHAVERFSSLVAMKSRYPWGYQSIAYQELGRLISYLGTGFIGSGLKKGDRVVLIAENSPEWGLVYMAVTSCGAAIIPLDIQLNENEIRHLLLHSGAKFLVTSPRIYSEKIENLRLEGIQVIVTGERESEYGGTALGEVMANGKERISNGEGEFFRFKSDVSPDDIAAVCYTSGTTGQPKGAILLHHNLTSNVDACRRRIPFKEKDVFLSLLPLHHTLATTCNLLAPLSGGCTIIFGKSLKARDIREDIERESVTILVGVPLLFEHMIAALHRKVEEASNVRRFLFRIASGIASGLGRLFKKNVGRAVFKKQLTASGLGSLRFCVSGAAPLRPDVEDAFYTIGIPILQGYGLTEASPVVSVNPLEKPKRGTVGPPIPGVEVKIDEPNNEGIGEITVRGPNVMQGYLQNPDATAAVLRNGWFYTGDIGMKDPEGYITIVGRKKDVIVTAGGKNVYPEELEEPLNECPFILESMVLAIKDRKGNDRVGAIIVPDYDALGSAPELEGKPTEEEIKNLISTKIKEISSNLPEYKRIYEFQIRNEEFPKTATHKIKRYLVKWIE